MLLMILVINGCSKPLEGVSITVDDSFGKKVIFVEEDGTKTFEAVFDESYFTGGFNVTLNKGRCHIVDCDNNSICLRCEVEE